MEIMEKEIPAITAMETVNESIFQSLKKSCNKKNSKSDGTDDAGYGNATNATNAEENNSQNQCGILFPVQEEVSATEADLIARIKTTGKEKKSEK